MVVILDERWVGKVALVTGASSGIGEAIAERLVEEGMQVVALARRKERLDQIAERVSLKKGKFYGLKTDLSKEEEILNAFKWVKKNLGALHVTVNCAGISIPGMVTQSETKNWTDVLQVNFIGYCISSRESVKFMKEINFDGHIININSILGHQVGQLPFTNIYPSSKHALTAFNEVLSKELVNMGSKIKVTSISPGLVDTEMIADSSNTIKVLQTFKEEITLLQPKDIAETVVYVLSTPPSVVVNELIVRPLGEV